jgi:cell division septum initiation protein DivIVA
MRQRLRLDGVEHDVEGLSPQARHILERLRFVEQRLQELHNQQAMLTKAKNAYIADLRSALLQPSSAASADPAATFAGFLRDDIDTF